MFAVAMPAWAFPTAIVAAVGVGLVALLIVGLAVFFIARFVKNRKAKSGSLLPGLRPLPSLADALNSPLVQIAGPMILTALHKHQHAVISAGIAQLAPRLAPYIGDIEAGLETIEDAAAQKLGVGEPAKGQ